MGKAGRKATVYQFLWCPIAVRMAGKPGFFAGMLEVLWGTRLGGGEGGIRTPDTLAGTPVFETGAINRSATSPSRRNQRFFSDAGVDHAGALF